MYSDENGHGIIAALLIAAGIGALVGVAGQLTSDIVHGALTGKWDFSWEQYIGAGLGGAISGLLYFGSAGGFLAGFIGSSSATLVGNGLEMIVGDKEVSIGNLIVDILASGFIGGIGEAIIHINGINRGSHSWHQVYKSGLTKVWHHGQKMAIKVMAKGFAMMYLTDYANTLYNLMYSFAEDNGYIIC